MVAEGKQARRPSLVPARCAMIGQADKKIIMRQDRTGTAFPADARADRSTVPRYATASRLTVPSATAATVCPGGALENCTGSSRRAGTAAAGADTFSGQTVAGTGRSSRKHKKPVERLTAPC